jgi:hypothetical protein
LGKFFAFFLLQKITKIAKFSDAGAPPHRRSIRSFALPAPAAMAAWWVGMLVRSPQSGVDRRDR